MVLIHRVLKITKWKTYEIRTHLQEKPLQVLTNNFVGGFLCQRAETYFATPRPILLWVNELGLAQYSSRTMLWANLCTSLASKNKDNKNKQIHMHFTLQALTHILWT